MTKKNKVIIAIIIALVAIAALVAVIRCCSSGAGDQAVLDPVGDRMNDKAYVAKLEHQREEQKAIVKQVHEAIDALNKAKAEGADSLKLGQLEAKVKKANDDLQTNRRVTELIVREKLLEQTARGVKFQK